MVSVAGNSDSPLTVQARINLLISLLLFTLATCITPSCSVAAATFQVQPKKPSLSKKTIPGLKTQSAPPTMMGPMHQDVSDLTIRTITLSNQTPYINNVVRVKATIYNLGPATASNFIVQFSYNGQDQTKTIRQLKAQKSSVVSLEITITEPAGPQVVEVEVNPGKTVGESSYGNNRQQKNLRARAPLTITPREKPTLQINKTPDIKTVIPGSLRQGSQTNVRLRGTNIDRFTRFDFGSCISQVGTPVFSDEIRVTLKVSDDCSLGRHPIKIKALNKEYTASAPLSVSPSARQQPKPTLKPKPATTAIIPPAYKETATRPDLKQSTPGRVVSPGNQADAFTPMITILAMTPNRWQQSGQYTVVFRGSNLGNVFGIDFGPKIEVNNFKIINELQVEAAIKVAADASVGHRSVNVLSSSPGQGVTGMGLATQHDGWIIGVIKKAMPKIKHEFTLPDDFLPRGIDLLEPNPNIYGSEPIQITEKTTFIWREKNRPVAETFEFRVLAADGTLLYRSGQDYNLQHPSQFFYSNIDLLIELHDSLENHLQSLTGVAAGESPISPGDARQEADLFWEVYGYLDNKAIESSERWPLKIGGKGPTGMLCETTNTQLVPLPAERNQPQIGEPEVVTTTNDQAYYPGEFVRIYGEFTLANSPWVISATRNSVTNQTDVSQELGSGNVIYNVETTTNGYRFDNVFIDWGDGSSEPISASLKNSKKTENFAVPLYDFSDPMILEMGHSYDQPGTYPVRIYVVPIDDMGTAQAIAGLNNTTTAQYRGTSPPATEHILLAASQTITSDAPRNYGSVSDQQALNRVGEEERGRVYQVYCNPMNIYIVQDPEATGPLKLQSVKILDFSSHSSPTASSAQRQNHTAPQTDMVSPSLSQSSAGGTNLSAVSSPADQVSIAADGSALSCDAGLWTEAELLYIGHGYIQLDWLLDGIVLKSEQLKVGPSTPRTDLGQDRSKWPPSESSTIIFQSPRLPVQNPMLHKLIVTARVIVDPTLSIISSSALQDAINRHQEGEGAATLPPIDNDTIDISFYSPNDKTAFRIKPPTTTSSLKASWGTSNSKKLTMGPPYRVVSDPKSYLATENDTDTPCQFQFPVENGFFIVANLRNLQTSNNGETYSGEGSLIFNLPDGPYSVKEHFLPISFTNWHVPDATIVSSGTINAAPQKQLDNLPGVKASLSQLTGQAGVSLNATMDVEISDPTLYSATSASGAVQKWTSVSAPLTPAGDWYSPPLALPLTRIGWSLVQIEAPDNVRIDLSHSEGLRGCTGMIADINGQQAPSGQNWVGLHLGPNALLHPYTFHLADQTIPASDWGVNSGGICGTARSDAGLIWNFGDAGGKIGWTDIEISAGNGTLSSNYGGFFVEMTWPKVKLYGDEVSFQYHGETVEPQMDLGDVGVPGGVITEEYGEVDMGVEITSFESRDKLWGINTNATFTFHEKNGSFDLFVPDLFFTINNDAEFAGRSRSKTLPTNIDSTLGGAGLELVSADITTGKRSLEFVHHAELKLGAKLQNAKTTVIYGIHGGYSAGDAAPSLFSNGPTMGPLEDEISITFPGGGNSELNKSTLSNVTYIHSDEAQELAGCGKENTLYAFNTYGGSFSDAWPDLSSQPLLAANGLGTGINVCTNDTFSASVDTSLFSSDYTIQFLFRYGEMGNGDPYWLMSGDKQDLNMTIYPSVFLSGFTGGLGYNFSPETIRSMECGGPSPNSGLILSAQIAISAVNTNVLQGNGVLTLDLAQKQAEIGLKDITLIGIDSGFSGNFTLKSNSFQGSILGDKRFFDGNIMLEGDAEIYLGFNDWYLNIGTINEPLNGRVFSLLQGTTYLTLDAGGFATGFKAGYDLDSGEVFGCSIRTYLDLGANLAFKTSPFSFSGTAYTASGITLVNPVKDIDIGTKLDFTVGCCSPKKLITSWSGGFCPGVKAGFTLEIFPNKKFKPYAKGCIRD